MGKKILLVGCGQLGSRHLQAIATLKNISEIYVIDTSEESLKMGQQRLKDVPNRNEAIKFHWLSELGREVANGDLCLIATNANGRVGLVERIAKEFGYQNFFLEKIVAQSLKDYKVLMDFVSQQNLRVWVHCQTRAYEVHKYIKSCLDPAQSIILSDIGGNLGLACNGIHYADLFVFYTHTEKIRSSGSRIDSILHSSRRGKDVFDLSGSLYATADNGSNLILSYSGLHKESDVLMITSANGKFMVDCIQQFAYECKDGGNWKRISIEESYLVSETTKRFVTDMLEKGVCELPDLMDCWPAHEYILTELLPQFNRLLKTQRNFCPVT